MWIVQFLHGVIRMVLCVIFAEASIETDFSGTTFTCCVIRDNRCVLANVGDSRSVLAFRNADGTIGTRSLTMDHKPDLPEEKVWPQQSVIVSLLLTSLFWII
jgi:serine/threonine protein phosphatase PrpC